MWFLDTMEGCLSREWDSATSLQQQLNTAEGQDRLVSLSIAGQLHRQVKDLPPGTRISGFAFEGDQRVFARERWLSGRPG